MTALPATILVTDTSILINFLKIDRADLLRDLSCQFIVTDHAAGEITDFYAEQAERFQSALASGCVHTCTVNDEAALDLFGRLTETTRLGVGESATIAHAIAIGASIALDDRRAIREAQRLSDKLAIVQTVDLVTQMIREDLITLDEADAIKDNWEANHRFRIPISTFADLI